MLGAIACYELSGPDFFAGCSPKTAEERSRCWVFLSEVWRGWRSTCCTDSASVLDGRPHRVCKTSDTFLEREHMLNSATKLIQVIPTP